jgi:hypothetical protein
MRPKLHSIHLWEVRPRWDDCRLPSRLGHAGSWDIRPSAGIVLDAGMFESRVYVRKPVVDERHRRCPLRRVGGTRLRPSRRHEGMDWK